MAAPMNEMMQDDISNVFRAWNTSDADEMMGPKTACTRDRAVGIQF